MKYFLNHSLIMKKLIIINRCSDKIYEIAKELLEKNIEDIIIIFKSNKLEKKSKLRNYFENKRSSLLPILSR